MPAVAGTDFKLSVDNGSGTYNDLAGQRSTTLNRGVDTGDSTSKDSNAWSEELPVIRNWSMDVEAVWIEGDTALVDLEDAYMNNNQISCRITTPGGTTYTGTCTVSDFTWEAPHDDIVTATITLNGSSALTKA